MYVCLCRGLKEADVRCVARSGCTSPEALIERLRLDADECCGRCLREIDVFVEIALSEAARAAAQVAAPAALAGPAAAAAPVSGRR
jgi:bacterioferritin-associated ferredoxin